MEKVAEKLEKINQTLEKLIDVSKKPENKFIQLVVIVGLFVGALGVVNIIDTVIKWFIGG